MKKSKFSKEEILSILAEESKENTIDILCNKYGIHFTTFYRWKNIYGGNNEKTKRNNVVSFKLSDDEKELLEKRCKEIGYENNVGNYIRKILFSKHILIGNPKEVREELYRARGEINKIGSNVNQIANYTNFLSNQKYIERDFIKDIIDETTKLKAICFEQRDIIDKALRKIFR